MLRWVSTAIALAALSGCTANRPYACPLKFGQDCRSMEDVYESARKAPRKSAPAAANSQSPSLGYDARPNTDAHEAGRPVFHQPHVYRPWLAPYVDADGNLRSGEYVYFATPGEWNYGTTRERGTASASTLFGPQTPDRLGFVPTPSAAQNRTASAQTPAQPPTPAAVTTREGITQPSETLIQR